MANQTIIDILNYDEGQMLGLGNGETTTINGGTVTVDGDTRWGQNGVVIGAVSISATIGGNFFIDATNIWEVPFSSSSGNVPTLDVLGSNGVTGVTSGATGELFRVWGSSGLDPLASGGSMPASGYVKLRSKTGIFEAGETINLPGGATVVASGAGRLSWMHVVARGTTTGTASRLTIPRLGNVKIEGGGWYEIGITNGSDGQTFQFPVTDNCPAIQIETAPASGEYEWWLCGGSRWGVNTTAAPEIGIPFIPTDERGKYFGCDNATGIIEIAKRTGNSCGFKPASGCRVRIPNLILSQADGTTPNYEANIVNEVVASRYGFTTTSGGIVDISFCVVNWYCLTSASYDVTFENCSILTPISLTNTANRNRILNCGVGLDSRYNANVITLTISTNFSGCRIEDSRFTRYSMTSTNSHIASITQANNISINRNSFESFGQLTNVDKNTGVSLFLTGCDTVRMDTNILMGSTGGITFSQCSDMIILNTYYADRIMTSTNATNGAYVFTLSNSTSQTLIDGIFPAFPSISNTHPYLGLFNIGTYSNGLEIRNVGTPDLPYNGGHPNSGMAVIGLAATTTFDIWFKRIYVVGLRTAAFTTVNTTQSIRFENIWADNPTIQVNAHNDSIMKGVKWNTALFPAAQTAVYGTHWADQFLNDTEGRLLIFCNEPLEQTADQCVATFGPKGGFTSVSRVSIASTIGQVIWTMPYYAIGYTKLGIGAGTGNNIPYAISTSTTTANHAFEYQIDKNDGNGFSDWKFLFGIRRRTGGGSAGAVTVTVEEVTSNRDPQVGDWMSSYVRTTGVSISVAAGTKITDFTSNVITFDTELLTTFATSEMVIYWRDIEDEVVSPINGFKLKVKMISTENNENNDIATICIPAVTNTVDQKRQYEIDVVRNTAFIGGIQSGSRLQIYNVTKETEIFNGIIESISYTDEYVEGVEYENEDIVRIRLSYTTGVTSKLLFETNALVSNSGWSVLANQIDDIVYNTYGIDGSLVDEFEWDGIDIEIDIDNVLNSWSAARMYAWFVNFCMTEVGIRDAFESLRAVDAGNIRLSNTVLLDNLSINTAKQTDAIRVFKENDSLPVKNPTTGGGGLTFFATGTIYTVSTGGSALTPTESEWLSNVNVKVGQVKKSTDLIPGLF
jgi:hypothetical protein